MDTEIAERLVYTLHADEFARLYSLLLEGNEKASLTAIEGERDVYVKHFVDSVACEGAFPRGSSVLEVGSGGGFPSIPLMIVRPDLSFTLSDCEGKKCSYLRRTLDAMGFPDTDVLPSRAEDLGRDPARRERYDVCCARAVAPMDILAELCLPLVRVGGLFLAYKGPDGPRETEEAAYALEVLGGRVSGIERYELPGGYGARCLVVAEKVSPTPEGYPRPAGRPKKRPLSRK